MAGRIITVAQQKGGSGKTTLTVNLAVALRRKGFSVAVLDTDPQGSLGRWFMERLDRVGEDAWQEFSTSSAWGVSYEGEKLKRRFDVVLIDTPPKIESDLRPALRVADLEASLRVLAAHGVAAEPVRTDPFTGAPFTFIADPDGLPIELVGPPPHR